MRGRPVWLGVALITQESRVFPGHGRLRELAGPVAGGVHTQEDLARQAGFTQW